MEREKEREIETDRGTERAYEREREREETLVRRGSRRIWLDVIHVLHTRTQKSIPTQICQLVLYIGDNTGSVAGFVRGLTFAERIYKHLLRDRGGSGWT